MPNLPIASYALTSKERHANFTTPGFVNNQIRREFVHVLIIDTRARVLFAWSVISHGFIARPIRGCKIERETQHFRDEQKLEHTTANNR